MNLYLIGTWMLEQLGKRLCQYSMELASWRSQFDHLSWFSDFSIVFSLIVPQIYCSVKGTSRACSSCQGGCPPSAAASSCSCSASSKPSCSTPARLSSGTSLCQWKHYRCHSLATYLNMSSRKLGFASLGAFTWAKFSRRSFWVSLIFWGAILTLRKRMILAPKEFKQS